MKYVISIFFPFIGFFLIKKPVSGYFALILNILILLGNSLYPTPIILFILWLVLILWAFLEINEYNTKKMINKVNKDLAKVNKSVHNVERLHKQDRKKLKKLKTISSSVPKLEDLTSAESHHNLLSNNNDSTKQLSYFGSNETPAEFDDTKVERKPSRYKSNLDNLRTHLRKTSR